MKRMELRMMVTILMICGTNLLLPSCKDASTKYPHLTGTMDGPLESDSAPGLLLETIARAERFHAYEIMNDSMHAICVRAIAEVDTTSTEGYGIIVDKRASSTTFPNLCNARSPMARYDKNNNTLWLTSCAVWGTGVQVDRLYQIRFDDNDNAYIAHAVDPYDLQQQLCQRLGYSIKGDELTFYDGEREIAQATNTVSDMGTIDSERPLWIGEQIQYDLSSDVPCLIVTPGVKFSTGLVLIYDDMPTLMAPLTISENGLVSIGDINEYKE